MSWTVPLCCLSPKRRKDSGDSQLTIANSLRRALPVTRQKMEWEKVSGYSLGSDLTKARA